MTTDLNSLLLLILIMSLITRKPAARTFNLEDLEARFEMLENMCSEILFYNARRTY